MKRSFLVLTVLQCTVVSLADPESNMFDRKQGPICCASVLRAITASNPDEKCTVPANHCQGKKFNYAGDIEIGRVARFTSPIPPSISQPGRSGRSRFNPFVVGQQSRRDITSERIDLLADWQAALHPRSDKKNIWVLDVSNAKEANGCVFADRIRKKGADGMIVDRAGNLFSFPQWDGTRMAIILKRLSFRNNLPMWSEATRTFESYYITGTNSRL